jgi:hypothetical protein
MRKGQGPCVQSAHIYTCVSSAFFILSLEAKSVSDEHKDGEGDAREQALAGSRDANS